MSPRLVLLPLLILATGAGAWALRPSDPTPAALASARGAAGPRVRSAQDAPSADEATPPSSAPSAARSDALRASRDRMMDAVHDLLDALDAEAGLDDAQRDRLEAVLTDERTRGFAAIEAVRGGPKPGQRPPDGAAIAQAMTASRDQADAEARAVLDDDQYAVWVRMRAPSERARRTP